MIKQFLLKIKNKFVKKFKVVDVNYGDKLSILKYEDLFFKNIDVLIIRNFLNVDEIEYLKNSVRNIPDNEFVWHEERYRSLPPVFEHMNNIKDLDNYFMFCNNREIKMNEYISLFSIENKCVEWFEKCFNKEKGDVSRIKLNQNFKHAFPSGCLRIIPPIYGEIKIHADNNFYPRNSIVFNEFSSTVNLSNHISYILTIQKAEEGGNLVLYDIDQLEYEELSKDGKQVVNKRTKRVRKIDSFYAKEIVSNEGDLVLFSGGRIWHSVNKMKGDTERITYGGFSAVGKDGKKIYLWT